jgi:predicted alpha/beta superfamily hydrolase
MDLDWRPYDAGPDSTVTGDVRISEPVVADYHDYERELLAYLPPSYTETDDSYPVVYMHDGRNLFDEATSNDGEWRVDETMERLASEGIEAIVVGIPVDGEYRHIEYAPFLTDEHRLPDGEFNPFADIEPMGDAYADFLRERVVPAVESQFRTREDRTARGVFGSSMGGLMAVYTLFRDSDLFGFAGAMSPAVGGPWRDVFPFVEDRGYVDARIYVDVGGREFPDQPRRSERFYDAAHELVNLLEDLGYDENLRLVVDEDATHHEDAWAERFPDAVQFLLG